MLCGTCTEEMGSRLRKKKREGCYNTSTRKRIGLGGKGRLKEAVINSLQNYYGKAIWGNVHDVAKTRQFGPIASHNIATGLMGTESWCKYNQGLPRGKEGNTDIHIPFQCLKIWLTPNFQNAVCWEPHRIRMKHFTTSFGDSVQRLNFAQRKQYSYALPWQYHYEIEGVNQFFRQ